MGGSVGGIGGFVGSVWGNVANLGGCSGSMCENENMMIGVDVHVDGCVCCEHSLHGFVGGNAGENMGVGIGGFSGVSSSGTVVNVDGCVMEFKKNGSVSIGSMGNGVGTVGQYDDVVNDGCIGGFCGFRRNNMTFTNSGSVFDGNGDNIVMYKSFPMTNIRLGVVEGFVF